MFKLFRNGIRQQGTHCEGEIHQRRKIGALTEMICRSGDESAAALFVLMGRLENSTNPKLLANTAKHIAFTRCGESNLYALWTLSLV